MEKEYKKIVLENGVRVILVPRKESLGSAVLVLVEAGSEYETKNINGLSHFSEHMMFKGTKNRPKPSIISSEMESLGAVYNAFTSTERTGYWAEVQSPKFDQAVDIVFDMYLNPILDPEEIEKERGVIIQELNRYHDNPQRHIYDLFGKVLYGDQPAGWEIIGPKENILRFKRDDFVNYRNKYYTGPSTVIVVAGNFNEKKIIKRIRETFGGLSRSKIGKPRTLESQKSPQIMVDYKKINQTNLAIGLRAYDVFDKRRFALDLLGEILGGGLSSRLYIAVREKLGAAYDISAAADNSSDHGVLEIVAGIENERIDKVIKTILVESKLLAEKLVSEKELQKAKDSFVGPVALSMQRSFQLASFYGSAEIMFGEPENFSWLAKKYQAVTKEEIKAVARDILKNEKLNLAMIGPYKEKDKSRLKKIFKF
ncbi:MAG: insulinase family protein [Patescibacteria group bacterium]|nr:insulinase family protein [Patescibacteria group bacterium]